MGVCVGLTYWIMHNSLSRIRTLEKKLLVIESDFEIIRERSRSNFTTFRKVVGGLDDVIQHMKISLDEEEEKIKVIESR